MYAFDCGCSLTTIMAHVHLYLPWIISIEWKTSINSLISYWQKLPQQVSFPSVRNGIHCLLHTPIQAHLQLDNCNGTLSPSVDTSEHVDHD